MIRYFINNVINPAIFLLMIFTGYSLAGKIDEKIAFTSILPQKDFVQRIAGNRFTVHALIGPGQNPHSYTPSPDQMARLSEAAVFFRIGVEFEEGILPKIKKSIPKLPIYDLRKGIKLRDMIEEHHHDNEHNGKHEHAGDHHAADHSLHDHHDHKIPGSEKHSGNDDEHHNNIGKDPHIWLSPRLVKQMGINIKDALIKTDPAGRQVFEKNFTKFNHELDSLNAYIRKTLAPVRGTELFVYHPAFGYFADEYDLVQKPVETGGKEPSARDLALLIKEAREYKPRVIFVQPQYARKSAETLAKQIGCAVVPINPMPEDYIKEMRDMCDKIHRGLIGDE
jgi:zinc transport system substrate-binding protein